MVPQLRARVEGLEAAAAEHETRAYDHARLQQEVATLRLSTARSPIASIAEEGARGAGEDALFSPTTPKIGLSRSASLMRAGTRPLSRSNSITGARSAGGAGGPERESRDSLADRVKDVEAQRDALHGALKSLLDRQAHQTREHAKRVRGLETERDRALAAHTPRRRGYEAEVRELRGEIGALRRRADDALEAKWQCEKGLGGLKMDLDRAESETGSLRRLLAEHDILVPDAANAASADAALADADATSATLEHAYRALRDAHGRSAAKLQSLESSAPAAPAPSAGLADQLRASARRIDELSAHVRAQLAANADLRARLATAVGSGERAQRASAARITGMQGRLRELEERVTSAQAQSEEGLAEHEADVRAMRDEDRAGQLLRLPTGGGAGRTSAGASPVVGSGGRSPRLDRTSSGRGVGMNEAIRTAALEGRVRELERALAEAEGEMGEVVQRMNAAQIEVAELQSARYV